MIATLWAATESGHTTVAGQTDTTPTASPPPSTSTPTLLTPLATPPQPTDWTWVLQTATALVILAAIAGLGLAAWLVLSRHRTSRRAAAKARRTQLQWWANGITFLQLTSEKLIEFESDVEAVNFTRPLLADANEPATAKFHTAYAAAQSLHTESAPPNDEQIIAFVTAAAAAAYAFGLADENARRKGRTGVIPGGRALTGEEKRTGAVLTPGTAR